MKSAGQQIVTTYGEAILTVRISELDNKYTRYLGRHAAIGFRSLQPPIQIVGLLVGFGLEDTEPTGSNKRHLSGELSLQLYTVLGHPLDYTAPIAALGAAVCVAASIAYAPITAPASIVRPCLPVGPNRINNPLPLPPLSIQYHTKSAAWPLCRWIHCPQSAWQGTSSSLWIPQKGSYQRPEKSRGLALLETYWSSRALLEICGVGHNV